MLAADAGVAVANVAENPVDVASTTSSTSTVGIASRSLVFVDPGVDDIGTLLSGVSDTQAEIVLLNGDQNGVDQISRVLASRTNVAAVHVIAHGSDGALHLGNATLDSETLASHAAQIRSWQNSFVDSADILLYGCNVASTTSGEQFVNELARLTGADIASSDDVTGSKSNGADWDLEYVVGSVEASLAFHHTQLDRYQATLATTIDIFAAGQTGEENLDIFIDQQYVTTFYNVGGDVQSRDFQRFVFESEQSLTADQVSVAFGNDAFDPATGFDRNLVVDKIVLERH